MGDNLVECISEMLEISKELRILETYKLFTLTYNDAIGGKVPFEENVIGVRLDKLESIIQQIHNKVYKDDSFPDFVILGIKENELSDKDKVNIYVQLSREIKNEYGNLICLERWYMTICEYVKSLKKRLKDLSEVYNVIMQKLDKIERILEDYEGDC